MVELVGANSRGQASTLLGISNTAEDCLAKVLFSSLVIDIIGIFIFLQNKIKFINSELSPEFDIKTIQSFFVIIPRSPWLAAEGCKKKEEEPIDESVEEIFEAI